MDDETRSRAYSPSSVLDGPIDPYIQMYIDQSAAAYAVLPNVQTLQYGPKTSNTLDLVMPAGKAPAPLHVFIHGGYWQQLGKRDSFFPALEMLALGAGFAALDYTLAPDATLDEIVDECCAALSYLHENAEHLGINPQATVVSGISAGAHLAAMCCLRLPSHQCPSAALLLSGVYELEPLIGTYINDAVQLDLASAKRNSPLLADVKGFPRTVIAWGGNETSEFKRQSQNFTQHLQTAGIDVESFEVAGRNHFDIVLDLANDTRLGRAGAALLAK